MAPAIEEEPVTSSESTEGAAPTEPPKKGRSKRKAKEKSDAPAAPKAGGRPTRITDAVVLKIGEGQSLIKRPKYRAILEAFGEDGKPVGEALKAAADGQAGKLKSDKFSKDPIGYLRSYLGELLACKALVAVSDGTEGSAEPVSDEPVADEPVADEPVEA